MKVHCRIQELQSASGLWRFLTSGTKYLSTVRTCGGHLAVHCGDGGSKVGTRPNEPGEKKNQKMRRLVDLTVSIILASTLS